MRRPVEGRGGATVVYEFERLAYPTDVDPEDRALLLDIERADGRIDLCRIPTDGGAEPEVLVTREDVSAGGGRYSPDGRWIAYHTQTVSGWDIFVIPSEGGDRKWQVTTDGAVYPHWSLEGTEIWVTHFSGTLHIVNVDGESDTFRVHGSRQGPTVTSPDGSGSYYDLHPDGTHLL